MTLRRRIILLALPGFMAAELARSADKLPPEFIGFWASDDSRTSGDQLLFGRAIYLTPTGRGAIVGGSPRVAFRIEAVFNASTSRLEYVAFSGDKPGPRGGMDYDQAKRVLFSKEDPGVVLRRRAPTVPEEIRRNLGL